MHRVGLDMELGSVEMVSVVAAGLDGMDGVRVLRKLSLGERRVQVIISTDDPDDVEIARELAWQIDPTAIQHAVLLWEDTKPVVLPAA